MVEFSLKTDNVVKYNLADSKKRSKVKKKKEREGKESLYL